MPSPVVLAVDFGTSHTVAVLSVDGSPAPLLFDGSPLLPSAVYAQGPDLVVGRDAVHSARLRPERFEPNPKRRVDDGAVLLGDAEVEIPRLFAAVLARVREEAVRVAGAAPDRVVVTHPAAWGPVRRLVLTDACAIAGFAAVTLVPEPVAAARYFAGRLGVQIADDKAVVVFDFGGGTFDASVVAATPTGFEVLAVDGSGELGGVDIDHALLLHIGRRFDGDPRWPELIAAEDLAGRRRLRTFLDDVRAAKERLSRQSSVDLLVPHLDVDTHLTRDELETITEPMLVKAVRLTEAVVRSTGIARERIAGVFLVGGASRMPLVATALHRGMGIAPTVIDQPELVVATGAAIERPSTAAPERPQPAAPSPPPAKTEPARPEARPRKATASPPPVETAPAPPNEGLRKAAPPPVPGAPRTGAADAPARPFAPTLRRLLWGQFGLLATQAIAIPIMFLALFPPAYIWFFGALVVPASVGFAIVSVKRALAIGRGFDRERRSIAAVQTGVLCLLGFEVAVLLADGGQAEIPVVSALLGGGLVLAAVILGLARFGPAPESAEDGLRAVRTILGVQLAMLIVVAAVTAAWWADFLTDGSLSAVSALGSAGNVPVAAEASSSGYGVFQVAALALVLAVMLSVTVVNVRDWRGIGGADRRRVLGFCQAMWITVAVLYLIPWFFGDSHRLTPVAHGSYGEIYLDVADDGSGPGPADLVNRLGLWIAVLAAAPAILVLLRLARLPTGRITTFDRLGR